MEEHEADSVTNSPTESQEKMRPSRSYRDGLFNLQSPRCLLSRDDFQTHHDREDDEDAFVRL